MERARLIEILELHTKWHLGESKGKRADLSRADLSGANLSGADLRWANLILTNLSGADLSGANLSGADLRRADLRMADLRRADLRRANLRRADLSRANLSGAKIAKNKFVMKQDALGFIVYKSIRNTSYQIPSNWKIEPNSYLEENVNTSVTDLCACGVNFANTIEWCKKNYPSSVIWKCRIEWQDAPSIVIPWKTDGKARCERLQLLEIVK